MSTASFRVILTYKPEHTVSFYVQYWLKVALNIIYFLILQMHCASIYEQIKIWKHRGTERERESVCVCACMYQCRES
jgi:hypothetical protein